MAKYVKFCFRVTWLINFGRSSVILVARRVANYAFFTDIVLFQLKRTCLQKFKKSFQRKIYYKESVVSK